MLESVKKLNFDIQNNQSKPTSMPSLDENTNIFETNQNLNSKITSNSVFSANQTNFEETNKDKELTKAEKKAQKEAEKAQKQQMANNPDGIIQGGHQGSSAGDCWLLSQMNSIANTNWGKDLLSKAISKDEQGNFVVNFDGVKKQYIISSEEFKKGQKSSYYSKQDADALILELAVEKHFSEENLNNGTIYGNDLAGKDSFQYLLSGAVGRQTSNKEIMENILSAMGKEDYKKGIAAIYVRYDNEQSANGMHHALSIKDVILNDKGKPKSVIVIDPYHPDKPIKKDYGSFINEAVMFGYTTKPLDKTKEVKEEILQ